MLQLTKGMPLQPNVCLLCSCTPTNDDGTYKKAVYAEGVDVDWGNSVYICWECANLIADLVSRVPRDFSDALEEKHRALVEAHAELEADYEHQEELITKIREGGAAQKALRAKATAS